MKLAFFKGCNIPARIEQYEASAIAVLNQFEVELVQMDQFTCCGYPMRNINEKSYLLPSIRNMALAEKNGLNIMVLCNCCFHSLQKAKSVVAGDDALLAELNNILAEEGLHYSGDCEVIHFLTLLYRDIGIEKIKEKITFHLAEVKMAVLHGCHVLRPREVTRFDNSFFPEVAGEISGLMGMEPLQWHGSVECCGAPLAGINDELSLKLLGEKVDGALQVGAECIVPLCSYCFLQLSERPDFSSKLPILLLPQLLGLCMGLDDKVLGIDQNKDFGHPFYQGLNERLAEPKKKKKKKTRS